mmetsp:Transcript_27470/g.110031  ORF Transcript_27470/g.110031 Transcript_27470/m.110031 type:complete len:298 (-) Transcript_27470:9-902(-)
MTSLGRPGRTLRRLLGGSTGFLRRGRRRGLVRTPLRSSSSLGGSRRFGGIRGRVAGGLGRRRVVAVEDLHDELGVRVDAHVGGDVHGAFRDGRGVEAVDFGEGARGGERERPARADAHDAVRGLEDVAVARELEGDRGVGDEEDRLEPPQVFVGAPGLGEVDAGARQLAGVLLELTLEALQERERVGRRAREAREDAVAEPADLLRVALDDERALRDHAVADERDLAALSDDEDGRPVHLGARRQAPKRHVRRRCSGAPRRPGGHPRQTEALHRCAKRGPDRPTTSASSTLRDACRR